MNCGKVTETYSVNYLNYLYVNTFKDFISTLLGASAILKEVNMTSN